MAGLSEWMRQGRAVAPEEGLAQPHVAADTVDPGQEVVEEASEVKVCYHPFFSLSTTTKLLLLFLSSF